MNEWVDGSSGALPEAVVVQFRTLDKSVAPFLPGIPNTVVIPTIQAEWLEKQEDPNAQTVPINTVLGSHYSPIPREDSGLSNH